MNLLYYLATPYSSESMQLMQARFRAACRVAARLLIEREIVCYCPIAHTHHIADELDNHADSSFWVKFDNVIMPKCDALIVAKLPGWKQSKGIQAESDLFKDLDKPIDFIDVQMYFDTREWEELGG